MGEEVARAKEGDVRIVDENVELPACDFDYLITTGDDALLIRHVQL